MSEDRELHDWQDQWREVDAGPAAVDPGRVRRETRRYRLFALLDYAVGLGLLAGSLGYALWRDEPVFWAWLAAVWALGLPALAFTIWNRRGLWGAADLSGRDHLRLLLRRSQRSRRALAVGFVLLAACSLVVLAFAFGMAGDGASVDPWLLAWLLVVVAAYLAVMVPMWVRQGRRRAAWRRLLEQMEE